MPTELQKRSAVYALLRPYKTPTEIIKILGYPKMTVYNIKKRLDKESAEFEISGYDDNGFGSPSPARKLHKRRSNAMDNVKVDFVEDLTGGSRRILIGPWKHWLGTWE